ncbi:MAG: DUF434 domain-containing protein [Phycisphaerae bacterium]
MPDKRKHRGRHPADERLFSADNVPTLRRAVSDYAWLLSRMYAQASALKLVGDRYNLAARQRLAVLRCTCSEQSLKTRTARIRTLRECRDASVAIDGYNVLITVEAALSGGPILVGLDSCCRDLASVHGTYRKVEETIPALTLIMDHLDSCGVKHVDWYLDSPVSNSGRLKTLIAELVEARTSREAPAAEWNIEIVRSPDAMLSACVGPVATSDSAVLDRCGVWVNLAGEVIRARTSRPWIVNLSEAAGE